MNSPISPSDGVDRKILLSQSKISKRVKELAAQISLDYKDKNPVFVGILRGSFIFMADIVRALDPNLPVILDFMEVSSYDSAKESSRQPRIDKDIETDISGKNVLVIEDLVDTGYSFDTLIKILKARNPKSLKTCSLLSKPARREIEVPIDYMGFEIPNVWIEGYGMDTDEIYRNLKDIWYRV
jgi:hypoxanthine phosphoribosyltransferase